MSLQVGSFCYATDLDAGRAACSSFVPVTTIDSNGIRTASCSGIDENGALQISVMTTDNFNVSTSVVLSQQIAFPPCVQDDYLLAGEQIAGAFLAAACVIYGMWKIKSYLTWNRGDHV